MSRYIGRRLLQVVPTLLIIVTAVFLMLYVAGDPVVLMLGDEATPEQIASLREALGLNEPLHVQYGTYLANVLQGDFGTSYRYGLDALPIVLERLPATLMLAASSLIFAVVVSVPLGIWSAVHRGGRLDAVISGLSVLAKAMPNFWLGIMLILLFAVTLKWLPVSGTGSWGHLVLPTIALGTGVSAEITRLVRSSMLDVLGQDFIRTARGKGLSSRVVLYRHALRNVFVPVSSITLLQFTGLLNGALVTEAVFAWPGMGQLLVSSITQRDMAIVQAAVFTVAVMVIVVNLATDVAFKLADRRIQLS
jgi:peptide/nickel transport system permease protein